MLCGNRGAKFFKLGASSPDQFSFLFAALPLPLELPPGALIAVSQAAPGSS